MSLSTVGGYGTNDLQSTCVRDDRIATKSIGNVRMQRMVGTTVAVFSAKGISS